jgi:hypothetical protein
VDVRVVAYSGHTFAEEPREFELAGQRYAIEKIVARWRTPAGPSFRILADGRQWVLSYLEAGDRWTIEGPYQAG